MAELSPISCLMSNVFCAHVAFIIVFFYFTEV